MNRWRLWHTVLSNRLLEKRLCLFQWRLPSYFLQMTVCFSFPFSLCLCSCLYTFTFALFVRNPENMNIVGMLMFKMELWASSAGWPGPGVLLTLISRYNRLIVPLMHKTCWLFCLETKKQEKFKSEEPHVCQPAYSSGMSEFVIVQVQWDCKCRLYQCLNSEKHNKYRTVSIQIS